MHAAAPEKFCDPKEGTESKRLWERPILRPQPGAGPGNDDRVRATTRLSSPREALDAEIVRCAPWPDGHVP